MATTRTEAMSEPVPTSAIDSVHKTLDAVDELCANIHQFMAFADADVLAELPPLHRARAFLSLAKATTTLFSVRLRCSGICPDDHPIRKEYERLNLFGEKLKRLDELDKAPVRPSTTLNYRAATRFIQHSLPDLTQEQKKSMRQISRGEHIPSRGYESNRAKKRKQQTSEKKSARAAAEEFLEKAARELRSSSNPGTKGPLVDISDDDE